MAQRGSGRPGGKARPAGRGPAAGKNSSPGRGSGSGGRNSSRQSAVAAQRAIKGARGRGGGNLLRVGLPIAVVVIIAAAVIVGVLNTGHNSTAAGTLPPGADTSTALLANTANQATGDTVDGVSSNDKEQVLFHVHAHLAMYVNGQPKLLPYGVGIVPPYQLQQTASGPFVAGGTKYYWLHTHDESGVIHIESPVQRTYTLGNFFDLWHVTLSPTQLGPSKGKITAFVNGKAFTGDPRTIPLNAHNVIQLDLGTVVPFTTFSFPQGE